MKLGIYVIRDSVAGEYGPPYVAKNDALALRQFQSLIKTTVSPLDFSCHYVGEFCSETADIIPCSLRRVDSVLDKE